MSVRSREPAPSVRTPAAPLLDWTDVRSDRGSTDADGQPVAAVDVRAGTGSARGGEARLGHAVSSHTAPDYTAPDYTAPDYTAPDYTASGNADRHDLAAAARQPVDLRLTEHHATELHATEINAAELSAADLDQLWTGALRRLRQHAPRSVVSTWLSQLQLLRVRDDGAWLAAADAPTAELIRVHYLDLIESALAAEAGLPPTATLRVQLCVAPPVRDTPAQREPAAQSVELERAGRHADPGLQRVGHDLPLVAAPETAEAASWREPAAGRDLAGDAVLWPSQDGSWPGSGASLQPQLLAPAAQAPRDEADLLSARLTFGTFVVGSSNELAASAARAVALVPGQQYNPLFLHGGVGLGKTHLLHAIGHLARERHPNLRVRYVAAETYIDDNLSAWRSKDGGARNDVRNLYRRDVDLLLVDDIQFLEGRDRVQEEFFHLFNALHQAGKQIVLTGDRFPAELTQLHDRLRSRFEWGLVAEISPPDRDLRLSILRQNAQRLGMALPHDVAIYLADHLRNNVRELEGALTKLLAHARIGKRAVDLQLARSVLGPLLELPARNLSVEVIQRVTAQQFGLKVTDLKGERRHRSVVVPRMVAMFLTRKHTQLSFPEIGRAFGGRDHSTVIHACQKIEWLLATDNETQAAAQAIESALGK